MRLTRLFQTVPRRVLAIALVALLTVAVGGAVLANDNESGPLAEGNDLLSDATLTPAEAAAIAERETGGTAGDIELERENGRLLYEVEAGGNDVTIDANDGTVVSVEADDDGGEDDDDDDGDDD